MHHTIYSDLIGAYVMLEQDMEAMNDVFKRYASKLAQASGSLFIWLFSIFNDAKQGLLLYLLNRYLCIQTNSILESSRRILKNSYTYGSFYWTF